MRRSITIQSPSTIGNVGVGFDVLGMALKHVGDEITLTTRDDNQLEITSIESEVKLTYDIEENAATAAMIPFLEHIGSDQGFNIKIKKFVYPGSGLGSSASSAVGGVFAANELLNKPLELKQLLPFAQEGERAACGTPILDNIAPALLGGIVLVHENKRLNVVELPVPSDLFVSLVFPKIEIKTADARAALNHSIPLETAIKQWGGLAGFVSALYTSNYDLLGESLVDYVVEPMRASLIPGFHDIQKAAMQAGALGCSISGSGPSIFAISRGKDNAETVLTNMKSVLNQNNMPYEAFVSGVNTNGVQILRTS